jgi:acyl transferase domain-containing protein/acyl carrier protein
MPDKILNLKGIKLTEISESDRIKVDHISKRDIAIIGMDGRFAEMKNLEEFWNALISGKDCIRPLPETRKTDIDMFFENQAAFNENREFQINAYMDNIDKFDYRFFNISPREAELMDPNQRIFLETVWRAIEDSGYGGRCLKGTKTGIFIGDAGNSFPDYKTMIYLEDKLKYNMSIPGNIKSIIASRISYIMDLKGPAITVDTACSSSLVAVHLACQSILSGECDMAVAGGVNIRLIPQKNESANIGIKSRDGRARTFDDSADGIGGGEGVAAMILKPLGKALSDGDSIYAVIKGSASNQDGSSIGITAPSSLAQEDVIVSAWRNAGIDPETISYIEAHGTGTKLGDPIEIEGISRAFGNFTSKRQFCSIGALKTNIGHLDGAAGIAGLVKAVLALKNRQIPPSIHFTRPNRKIDFEESPVYVNDKLADWNVEDFPRRCGVSSFGLSGTNCHMVLEEAPGDPVSFEVKGTLQLFTLSAASMDSFKALAASYMEFLHNDMKAGFAEICHTANIGRGHYKFRAAIISDGKTDLAGKLGRLSCMDAFSEGKHGIFFAKHDIVPDHKGRQGDFEITAGKKRDLSSKANELLKAMDSCSCDQYSRSLSQIGELYIKGADINWKDLYKGKRFRRRHLPVYPFSGERCWFADYSRTAENETPYHTVGWRAAELDTGACDFDSTGYVILFKDRAGIAERLKEELLKNNGSVIEVSAGTEYARPGEDSFIISGSRQDYKRLMEDIGQKKITNILHLFTASKESGARELQELERRLESSVYSIFNLLKAITGTGIKNQIRITAVTRNIYSVTGTEEDIVPENAAMLGLMKVIGREHPDLVCRCVDIGDEQDTACIIKEMKGRSTAAVSAYRQGKRYVEYLDHIDLREMKRAEISIRDTGAYIITGGMGGIGIETAKWLTRKGRVKLVLIGRSRFPERCTWDSILSGEDDKKLCNKIKKIREMEETGSKIELVSADITDIQGMEPELERIRKKYGRINGIIHSAGIAGDGFLFRKDEETLKKVLYPKIHGTWVIDRLTAEDPMDFFVSFSSVTSIGGAQGQGDYTAANSFLDSFTDCRNRLGKRTLTINWPAWKETGMAVEYGADMEYSIMKPISTDEALTTIEVLLGSNLRRAVAGHINYPVLENSMNEAGIEFSERIRKEIERHSSHKKLWNQESDGKKKISIELSGNHEGSYTDTQRKLAQIWAEILGLKEVSIYSNFSELGGDSILAVLMIREIQKEYPGKIDIADVFSYPTIYEISQYIDGSITNHSRKNESEIDDVLDMLEKGQLSVDKAAALMETAGEKEWKR